MNKKVECPICKSDAWFSADYTTSHDYIDCPTCGVFYMRMGNYINKPKDNDKLASFLFYNGTVGTNNKTSFCFISTDEVNKVHKDNFKNAVIVNNDIVDNWYPKTFSEKIDLFLLMLADRSNYVGDLVVFSDEQLLSACFAKRETKGILPSDQQISYQKKLITNYLIDEKYVEQSVYGFIMLPEGWKRVDELQKKKPNNKNVFVAMSFAPEMAPVRDAIKAAITECGYIPRIMDEIEHNHQIVPEMLYEIRQAKFVIAELTGHNNGAYFEAGYALGQGKDVIQLCRKDAFGTDGHFDVKQVSTILWEDEEDLTKRLINRIKATIE